MIQRIKCWLGFHDLRCWSRFEKWNQCPGEEMIICLRCKNWWWIPLGKSGLLLTSWKDEIQ